MEEIFVAIITGGLALVGVIITNVAGNRRAEEKLRVAQAITDAKIEELTREVRKHNNFAEKNPRNTRANQGRKPSSCRPGGHRKEGSPMKTKWRNWLKAAGVRAVKTIAQTAVATIGTSAVLGEVDWIVVASASVLAGVLSLLTSVAGLPELPDTDGDGFPDQ